MSRVVLALLMSVGVGTHVYHKVNSPNPEWLIYMTNQVGIHFKSVVKIFFYFFSFGMSDTWNRKCKKL